MQESDSIYGTLLEGLLHPFLRRPHSATITERKANVSCDIRLLIDFCTRDSARVLYILAFGTS